MQAQQSVILQAGLRLGAEGRDGGLSI